VRQSFTLDFAELSDHTSMLNARFFPALPACGWGEVAVRGWTVHGITASGVWCPVFDGPTVHWCGERPWPHGQRFTVAGESAQVFWIRDVIYGEV